MRIKYPTLDNIVPILVSIITISIIGMTFTNYAICNFKLDKSLHFLYLVNAFGKDKKPPSKCDDNTSQSAQTLMALLATIIALKADLRKKDEQPTSLPPSSQEQTEV